MRKYKTPVVILRHTREFLADPANYAQGTLAICVTKPPEGVKGDTMFPEYYDPPTETPLIKRVENEHCAHCILGGIREFTDPAILNASAVESNIVRSPAGHFAEQAARELYPNALLPVDGDYDAEECCNSVDVNDGGYHKTPYGAYRATLRVLDRAIELAS